MTLRPILLLAALLLGACTSTVPSAALIAIQPPESLEALRTDLRARQESAPENADLAIALARVELRLGHLEEAEPMAIEVLTLVRDSGQPDAAAITGSLIAAIRYEQGRLGEMEAEVRELADQLPAVPFFRALLALCQCQLGRFEDARSSFAPLREDPGRQIFDYYAAPTAALLAMVASELGDAEAAARIAGIIAPYADQVASHPMAWFGSYQHHMALLCTTMERFAEAEAYFLDAAATHKRLGSPTWLTRTRLECGRMLVRRDGPGDAARGRDLLLKVLDDARTIGTAGIERQAAALLS